MEVLDVKKSIIDYNDRLAKENKEFFDKNRVFVVNIISAPGSGKTTLLEKTYELLKDKFKISFLIGDVDTDRDGRRLKEHNADVYQIVTGGACHLEAPMIKEGLKKLSQLPDILFIENVGNLVCPASFYLGEHVRVVMVSVPEGDEKPGKYPKAFKTSQAFVISKIDLIPYFDFDLELIKEDALKLNPNLKIFPLSVKTGDGISEWVSFIESERKRIFEDA